MFTPITRPAPRGPRAAALGLAAAVVGLTACGDGGATQGSDDDVTLEFAFWGSDYRLQLTEEIIETFEAAHPGITVEAAYGDSGYWDQMATRTAAGDMPDIVQMDDKYLREYADRDALMELSAVDVDGLDPDIVDNGRTEDGLYGVTIGINSFALVANPDLFDEAGVDMPDDSSWTWDDYRDITVELSENLDDGWGAVSLNQPGAFQVWLRQHGANLTTEDGELGFDEELATDYFQYFRDLMDDGGMPPADALSEDMELGPEQSQAGLGHAALSGWWTNELPTLANASGAEMELLRFPSETGQAEDHGMWFKSSMLLSASSDTEHPEEVQAFIEHFISSEDAGLISLTDRGLPADENVRAAVLDELEGADARSAEFVQDIEPELGEPEPVPAIGFSTMRETLFRYESEVYFDRLTPQEAAAEMMAEMESSLQ
ncbi:ABC transporter substrate-binding protein [Nesterenkonia xinjiangensis]|uniref:Multiple sugar transport system substrate-binding protein n=1 Tax=Nesterenkonia xinjiangensis TaxID=225327 RepID=A0A7Z0K8P5_9MICC|nr:extracellular solute-binding protein [Nesterenkonia xinjiangensis]NYJ77869.1 multiple sugar transport system substrate-binding protein [Nesterenkonia xinjiangensis]